MHTNYTVLSHEQKGYSSAPYKVYSKKNELDKNTYAALITELLRAVPAIRDQSNIFYWETVRKHVKTKLGIYCDEILLINTYKQLKCFEKIARIAPELIRKHGSNWATLTKEVKASQSKKTLILIYYSYGIGHGALNFLSLPIHLRLRLLFHFKTASYVNKNASKQAL